MQGCGKTILSSRVERTPTTTLMGSITPYPGTEREKREGLPPHLPIKPHFLDRLPRAIHQLNRERVLSLWAVEREVGQAFEGC
jgi:hypothetical protein